MKGFGKLLHGTPLMLGNCQLDSCAITYMNVRVCLPQKASSFVLQVDAGLASQALQAGAGMVKFESLRSTS